MIKCNSKKGQIGIEIMYSIGVLLAIFILLTSVTFERRISVEKSREMIDKKNDCVMVSDKLISITSLGDGYSTQFKTLHNLDIYANGLIVIGDFESVDEKEIEILCQYTGKLNQTSYENLTGSYNIIGENGVIRIE
jgi:hypothetical protein